MRARLPAPLVFINKHVEHLTGNRNGDNSQQRDDGSKPPRRNGCDGKEDREAHVHVKGVF